MGACEVSSGCYEIYSIGSAKFLKEVFNSVAMVCGSDNFVQACAVAIMLGIILIIVKGILTGGGKIEVGAVVVSALVASIMFVPKGTVIVEDVYDGSTYTIDNVPVGVAAPGMFISRIGYSIAELIDQGFSTVDTSYGITRRPFLESTQILTSLRDNSDFIDRVWDQLEGDTASDLKRSFLNYFQECSMLKFGFDKTKSMAKDYKMSSDNLISDFRSDVRYTEIYLDGGSETLTCTRAGTKLKAKLSQLNGTTLDNAFKQPSTSGESYSSKMDNAVSLLGGSSADMINMVKSSILKPIYEKAAQGFLISTGDIAAATAINQAISQRNVQWSLEQSLFLNTIRPMITFFEGFVYAITPFMAILICMGAFGLGIAIKYFQTLIWIQLWLPILAIINLYIYMSALSAISTNSGIVGQHLDSFYAIDNLVNVVETWTSTGGMLAAMTPMIAFFIVAGSAYTFTSIAGRLGGADHIDEKIVSPDVVKQNPLLTNEKGSFTNTNYGINAVGAEAFEDYIDRSASATRNRQIAETRLNAAKLSLISAYATEGLSSKNATENFSASDSTGTSNTTSSADSNILATVKNISNNLSFGDGTTNTNASSAQNAEKTSWSLSLGLNAPLAALNHNTGHTDTISDTQSNARLISTSTNFINQRDKSKNFTQMTNDIKGTNKDKSKQDQSAYGDSHNLNSSGRIGAAIDEYNSAQRQYNEALAVEQRTGISGKISTKAAVEAIRNSRENSKDNWNKIFNSLTSAQDKATLQAKTNYYQNTLKYDQDTAQKAALLYTAINSDNVEASNTALSMLSKATGNNYINPTETTKDIDSNKNMNNVIVPQNNVANEQGIKNNARNTINSAGQNIQRIQEKTDDKRSNIDKEAKEQAEKNKGIITEVKQEEKNTEDYENLKIAKKLPDLKEAIKNFNECSMGNNEDDSLVFLAIGGLSPRDEYDRIGDETKKNQDTHLKLDEVNSLFLNAGFRSNDAKKLTDRYADMIHLGKDANITDTEFKAIVKAFSPKGINNDDAINALLLLRNREKGLRRVEGGDIDATNSNYKSNMATLTLASILVADVKNKENFLRNKK